MAKYLENRRLNRHDGSSNLVEASGKTFRQGAIVRNGAEKVASPGAGPFAIPS
jgi:hypothetical protein